MKQSSKLQRAKPQKLPQNTGMAILEADSEEDEEDHTP